MKGNSFVFDTITLVIHARDCVDTTVLYKFDLQPSLRLDLYMVDRT